MRASWRGAAPRAAARCLLVAASVAALSWTSLAQAAETRPWPAAPKPVAARHGMVVTAHRLASRVGVDILKKGGNAIDAAVAVGYALAVVYPVAGNIGGGGFMTLRLADGRETFLDFRERAPLAAKPNMYLGAEGNVVPGLSTDGWLSVGVPGTVMGLETARQRWGTMTRAALLRPAIDLAQSGFVLTRDDSEIVDAADLLRAHPALAAQFMKPDGSPYRPGERLTQPKLAATLRLIARQGANAFYQGPIADQIVAASTAGQGILSKADLRRYRARELRPIFCRYRGYRIISAPPPSSGGVTLCEMLHIVEGFPLDNLPFHSAEEVHDLVEAMRLAYADRNNALGDPAFVENPVARLIDRAYAARLRARIDPVKAGISAPPAAPPHEGTNTTHFSIVDARGNAVSVTYTLNTMYGAKVIAGDTGIVMNDEMDDFTAKPGVPNTFGLIQGEANAIAPGKTPLSSMTPTIVTRRGRTVMVIGSPGGPRIITTVFEAIVNAIDHGMTIAQAIAAPRIHHQWLPDVLYAEDGALTPKVADQLGKAGYTIREHGHWSLAEGLMVGGPSLDRPSQDPRQRIFGASDPRGATGAAVGY
jgi:gamma-glutamyltranspeptidase/glutathione hydrolase